MANVIKHKRGSGSDPVASDLVVGEVAIRTDVGKLFTKMDNGSVAEIAGGGSDIAINTLSSSSGTGGGSATFNGSAYRFTLSAPPSVSAQQLLVSINGVIQKPVAGTGQPSEGFSVDGTDIILGDAPATGSDFFILTFKSLGVSEPADNSVTSAKIVDGAIVNADINASAAIAGTKISPNFGTQDLLLNGKISLDNSSELGVFEANTSLGFTNSAKLSFDFSSNLARIRSSGNGSFSARPLTFNIVNTEAMRIDTSGKVGIGTTSPSQNLMVVDTVANEPQIRIETSDGGSKRLDLFVNSSSNGVISAQQSAQNINIKSRTNTVFIQGGTSAESESMRIDSSGRVLIGTTSGSDALVVDGGSDAGTITTNSTNSNGNFMTFNCSGTGKFFIGSAGSFMSGHSGTTNQGIRAEGALAIATGGTTERMRIDSDGQVGMGTTSPAQQAGRGLHINGTDQARLKLTNASSGATANDGFDIILENGLDTHILNHENGNLKLGTNDAERMRIDSSGNVGIGTTSPQNPLTVAGNGDTAIDIVADLDNNGVNNWPILNFRRDSVSGTPAARIYQKENDNAFVIDNSGSERMRIDSSGRVGIGTSSPGSYNANSDNFVIRSSGTTGMTISGSTGGDCQLAFSNGEDTGVEGILVYQHGSNEFLLAGIESDSSIAFRTGNDKRMIIDSSGNKFMDNNFSTTDINARKSYFTSNGQQHHARGAHEAMIVFSKPDGTQIGSIARTVSNVAYNTSSDYRLKENISGISDGITRLKQLKPSRFNFISDPDITMDGFIAHEVSSVVPEAIEGEKDGVITQAMLDAGTLEGTIGDPIYQGIDQSKLVPLLVAALQEAIGRIEVLEAK